MGMIVHDVVQRSPEWRNLRRGIISGSEVGKFISVNGAVAQRAKQNLIFKKLGEIFGHEEEEKPPNYAMKRGIALEPEARADYERVTGYSVSQVGFCVHDSAVHSESGGYYAGFGCSPDGLIENGEIWTHGVEIKCPLPATQVKYLMEGVVPEEYLPQIHCCMAVTGVSYWDFYSYCPGLPYLLKRVHRDRYTEYMKDGLASLCATLVIERAKIVELWKSQNEKEASHD